VLSPEEQMLNRYFEASRLYDTTVVARIAAEPFNPRRDGIVEQFEVQQIERQGDAQRVIVAAAVRQPDGRVAPRTLHVTMARRDGRLFITQVEPAP
jgi:hypothetical protein